MMQSQQTNFLLIKENSANLHFFIEKNCVTINQKSLVTRKTQPELEPLRTEQLPFDKKINKNMQEEF